MTNSTTKDVAKHINEDRMGPGYYKDPDVLAPYLRNSLQVSEDKAVSIANHICDDGKGAKYYEDTEILSKYLEGQTD